jgi:hypothetical protein
MRAAREELETGVVLRLAPRNIGIDYNASGLAADAGDFALSTTEDAERKITGVGSLSVWDAARTTPEEANAFLPEKPRVAFTLNVAAIRERSLHVFRSPLKSDQRGADGHCSLEDVWSSERKTRERIRGQLAIIAGTGILLEPSLP